MHEGRAWAVAPLFTNSSDASWVLRHRRYPVMAALALAACFESSAYFDADKALHSREPVLLYECHDIARTLSRMLPIPSKCTTAAAVRMRVRKGQMTPQAVSERGGALWTWDGMTAEIRRERYLQAQAVKAGIADGDTSKLLRRWAAHEARQLVLREAW